MQQSGALIGVDVGGTFTDAVVITEGRIFRAKSPSTYPEVGRGVVTACRLAAESAGFSLPNLLPEVGRFGLGTTAVTNVIATRSGLRVGLLTTKGFEHALFLARGRVQEVDGWMQPVRALVDPSCVVGIDERIDCRGKAIKPIDLDQVIRAGRHLLENQKVDSIAVSFLWSFVNPVHEDASVQALKNEFPRVHITGGAALRPTIREYERTTLAVLNSYSFGAYEGIENLSEELREMGLQVPILLCHSGGGTISIGQGRAQPVLLAESGPAAGVMAAALLARMSGETRALTCDMGGTSFDVSHIDDGSPARIQRGDLMGMWTALPRVDVESVGAGGGSVAWLDERAMLRVGPRSAGSMPGPACYGRGGKDPTVTDALLLLGYLDPNRFLGGQMELDRAASMAACARVGAPLSFNAIETAWGIRQIALAEMAQAARRRLAVRAFKPQDYPLVSYGGCGSLFTGEIARAIGAPRVLVPNISSVLSAFGAAITDVRRERVRALLRALPTSAATIDAALMELKAAVEADLTADAVPEDSRRFEFEADVRFAGQRWEMTVSLPVEPGDDNRSIEIEAIFRREYLRRYGPSATGSGEVVELVALRAIGIGTVSKSNVFEQASSAAFPRRPAQTSMSRLVHWDRDGEPLCVQTFDGSALRPGDVIEGPALVDRADTTVWIPSSTLAHMDGNHTIIMEIGA